MCYIIPFKQQQKNTSNKSMMRIICFVVHSLYQGQYSFPLPWGQINALAGLKAPKTSLGTMGCTGPVLDGTEETSTFITLCVLYTLIHIHTLLSLSLQFSSEVKLCFLALLLILSLTPSLSVSHRLYSCLSVCPSTLSFTLPTCSLLQSCLNIPET